MISRYLDEYPEQECAKKKAAEIEKLKEDAEDAEKQEKCKEGSKDRNQGLQYVNEKEHKQKTNSLQKISSLALSLLIKSWVVQKH
jgi:hypothetical protein